MMPIVAQYLFGSRARGDAHSQSDIDILSVLDSGRHDPQSISIVNISYYTYDHLISESKSGGLFALHLYEEAVLIFDTVGFDSVFRHNFRYRENFDEDINRASDLGWFLLENSTVMDAALLNRRISWVARTILIAISANRGAALFSPQRLANLVEFEETNTLLRAKELPSHSPRVLGALNLFLVSYGVECPLVIRRGGFTDVWRYFRDTNNNLGLKTMSSTGFDPQKEIYS